MRLFSSKKICIMIAAAGVLFAGLLIGMSVNNRNQSAQTFEAEGYILTLDYDEEQNVISLQNRFGAGEKWNKVGVSSVAFSNVEGSKVTVENDSFIHYDNQAVAAVCDAAAADLDAYAKGYLNCYHLEAGASISRTGKGFVVTVGEKENVFQDVILKSSENNYFLASEKLTITLSSGEKMVVDNGYLELSYVDEERKIIQLSDGENAWQLVAKNCTIAFKNGAVLSCENGDILRPGWEDGSDAASLGAEYQTAANQKLTLGNMNSDDASYVNIAVQQNEPTFRFTLYDGEDGEDGESGEDGTVGEDGEDGEDGEEGEEGEKGKDGAAGANGANGQLGATSAPGPAGSIETVETKVGIPTVYIPDGEWLINGVPPKFSLAYESDSYDFIDATADKAYIYLYDVNSGEIIQEWKNETLTDVSKEFEIKESLKADTTYGLAVVDTYGLNGTNYTTKLLDRIFITDATGIYPGLLERTDHSFTACIESDAYVEIQNVRVTLTAEDGTKIEKEFDGTTDFSAFVLDNLKSNHIYKVEMNVEYVSNGLPLTKDYQFQWKTLKKQPTVGGVELYSENGYLVAYLRGPYDSANNTYGEIVDPDKALLSATYGIYTEEEIEKLRRGETAIPLLTDTIEKGGEAYFRVDGELLKDEVTYYVVADYTWEDGSKTLTAPVMKDGLRAEDSVEADLIVGASISFSGNGTKLFNVSDGTDITEGTTYETIAGALMVDLNGLVIGVDNNRKLDVLITDNLTYEKKLSYTECEGKQGNLEGNIAIPIDIDGLLMNNVYAVTLSGYVYNQSADVYEYRSIGTLTIRTDAKANIDMGVYAASVGGVGVDFWLGNKEQDTTILMPNYFHDYEGIEEDTENDDDRACPYYDDDVERKEQYLLNTDASYRNVGTIVFELYAGQSENPNPSDLIGVCEVAMTDEQGDIMNYMPGYSPMYEEYYGHAAAFTKINSVGVGDAFTYRFEYNYATTKKTGVIPESELPRLSDGKFTIKVRTAYDYTYNRYNYNGGEALYDYFLPNPSLEMEDYVNELTINGGAGLVYPGIVFQERPIHPDSVVKDGYALHATELFNADMGAYNGRTDNSKYDQALQDDTMVGIHLSSFYKDTNKITRAVTIYGTTYEKHEKLWKSNEPLNEIAENKVKDAAGNDTAEYLFDLKFTFPMEETSIGADGKEIVERRETMPQLNLIMYNTNDTDLTNYLSTQGFEPAQAGDRGYSWRQYDEASDTWNVYVDDTYLYRGRTYVFTYETLMQFVLEKNEGNFHYPADYYKAGWIAGKIYAKNTALRSEMVSLFRQTPYTDVILEETAYRDKEEGSVTQWKVYLNDPDGAVLPDSLLGYRKGYDVTGGIYNIRDELMTNENNGSLQDSIKIKWTSGADNNNLVYLINHSEADLKDEDTKAYYDKIYGSINNKDRRQSEPLVGKLEDLIAQMRQVTTDVNGNVTSAGLQITMENIAPNGIYYSWRVGYRVVDDYELHNTEGMIPLISHRYSGYDNWSVDSDKGEITSLDASTGEETVYDTSVELDEETNNIVYIDFNKLKGSDGYSRAMRRITGVRIGAEKWSDATQSFESVTNQSGNPITIWKTVVTGSTSYVYFELTEFGSAIQEGDKVRFSLEIYYDTGNAQRKLDENTYYVAKSVNSSDPVSNTNSYFYFTESHENKEDDITINNPGRQSTASRIMYKIDSLQKELHAVWSNDGIAYLKDSKQTYRVTEAPLNWTATEKAPFTRSESLSNGEYLDQGYTVGNVAEFNEIKMLQLKTEDFIVKAIAPELGYFNPYPKVTSATAKVKIDNYDRMQYPVGDQPLHLYYAVYEAEPTKDEDGNPTFNRTLVGVTVGESNSQNGYGDLSFTGLKRGTRYHVYIYYKDNRNGDARTDEDIFEDELVMGEFITGEEALKMAKKFTNEVGGKLDPKSDEPVGEFKKILYMTRHELQKAGVDENGYPIPLIAERYEEFHTMNGIAINTVSFTPGFANNYMQSEKNGNWVSGKQLKASFTTNYAQDENTKAFFAIERCSNAIVNKKDSNWETILADKYCPTESSINPGFHKWETGQVDDNRYFQYYGSDVQMTPLWTSAETNQYTAELKMTYYPGGFIEPGYSYRVKAFIFQCDGTDATTGKMINPLLVGVKSSSDNTPYSNSNAYTWAKHNPESQSLVKINNVQKTITEDSSGKDSYGFSVNVRVIQTYTSPDNQYFVKLFKIDNNGNWLLMENGSYVKDDLDKTALSIGSTYAMNFINLDPDTRYGLRFYGLNDLDYNNELNVIGNSVPLRNNKEKVFLYTNLPSHYANGTPITTDVDDLYRAYLGIASAEYAEDLELQANADEILLRSYGPIKTFAANQLGTVGEWYQTDVFAEDKNVKLYFEGAFGLENAAYADYTIGYYGDAEPVSGRVMKNGNSIMDDGRTSGDVTLTIKNDKLDLTKKGNYYIQLELHQADGTTLEKPPTIEFVVK